MKKSSSKRGSVRVISGKWRGRRLQVAHHEGLRPTTDQVRETLFNWLMHSVQGARCLDLFAGSGALGLECLSRGAAEVMFVDCSVAAVKVLRQNLAELQVSEGAEVVCADALNLLSRPPSKPYDLVFLDPPYVTGLLEPSLLALHEQGWLSPVAQIYLEFDKRSDNPKLPEEFAVIREKANGQCRYGLYQVIGDPC